MNNKKTDWKAGDKFRFRVGAEFYNGSGYGIHRNFREDAKKGKVEKIGRIEGIRVYIDLPGGQIYFVTFDDIEPVHDKPIIIIREKDKE